VSNRDPALQNYILANLPRSALDFLRPHLEPVSLPVREVLESPNKLITHVYFPIDCINSVVAGADEQRIEVGIIGRDGMTGLSIVLGVDASPHECFTQIPGDALRIATHDLNAALETEPMMRKHFLLYIRSFMLQSAQTALANGRYTIEERLARWLLMCRDRLDSNDIPLTHEFLSLMLGVRRPGVTLALQNLETARFIRNRRGCVTVLNRPKLQEIAGVSYSPPPGRHH
jgi:CRP-like cAMP-binding protein